MSAIEEAPVTGHAWDRAVLAAHFTLCGFVAMRADRTKAAAVGDPTDRQRTVMLYRSLDLAHADEASVRLRNELWHEVPWRELTAREIRRAYVLAVREGWLP